MKDERSEVSDAVTSVFRKVKRRSGPAAAAASEANKRRGDVEKILRAVEAVGDHSKTLDCLFINVPSIPYVDPTLDRNHAAHEWLSSSDVYRSHKTSAAANNSAEHHSMQKLHMPPAAAAVHLLCRVETRQGLSFSTRELSDARYGAEANGGLLGRFAEGLSPRARAGIRGDAIAADVVPYCLWLLSAGGGGMGGGRAGSSSSLGRAVSSVEVLTEGEREAFRSHVDALRSLGLTYVKADDGDDADAEGEGGGYGAAETMRLEPEIDRVVMFEGLEVTDAQRRSAVPSVLKELLAHGVNLENMREREREAKKKPHARGDGDGGSIDKASSSAKAQAPKDKITGNALAAVATATPVTPKELTTTFGGRRRLLGEASQKIPAAGTAPAAVAKNFLGLRAAKAKAARTARRAATVGFDRSKKKARMSHSGSGAPLDAVIRYKYQKGFTQAVRVPCRVDDLVNL